MLSVEIVEVVQEIGGDRLVTVRGLAEAQRGLAVESWFGVGRSEDLCKRVPVGHFGLEHAEE